MEGHEGCRRRDETVNRQDEICLLLQPAETQEGRISQLTSAMDIWSREKRSEVMSRIRNKGTKPEVTLRKALFARGFRYRVNVKTLPGKPDIVLPRYKTVIFVHGCFWHGHPGCKYAYTPKSNTEFWVNKISGNRERDAVVKRELEESGWKVIIVWECEIRHGKDFSGLIERLSQDIRLRDSNLTSLI